MPAAISINKPKRKPHKRRVKLGKTAEDITKAAIWAFIAFLASGIAAAIGGYLATPKDIAARTATTAV